MTTKVKKTAYSKKMKDQVKAKMVKKCPEGYKKSGKVCIKISGSKNKKKPSTAHTILGINF